MDPIRPNPFRVLKLPARASKEDIAERGRQLVASAATEQQRRLYRWAAEELSTDPLTRLTCELFEIPDADYEREDWEQFCRSHAKNPLHFEDLFRQHGPPSPEDFDVAALLDLILEGMLTPAEADLEAAVDNPPYEPGYGPPPLEVRDVIFG
jgi:hypothetical protein